MIKISNERSLYRTANQRLRRARRLYVSFNRHKIFSYGNEFIDFMADRMLGAGMYSEKSHLRSIRQSIQGHLFRVEKGRDWHEWVMKMGLDPYTGYFKPIHKMQA